MDSNRSEAIKSHYRNFWQIEISDSKFDDGPIGRLPNDFRVIEAKPTPQRALWTYATCCMSQVQDDSKIEIYVLSKDRNEVIIELLYAVSYFHRNESRIGLNHTVYFGKPWSVGSICDYGLISLPYLDGPSLEKAKILGDLTHFYWLIPITKNEVEIKKSRGLEFLERKFDNSKFDYADPLRQSVV